MINHGVHRAFPPFPEPVPVLFDARQQSLDLRHCAAVVQWQQVVNVVICFSVICFSENIVNTITL